MSVLTMTAAKSSFISRMKPERGSRRSAPVRRNTPP
jgi:hypothetical protein